MKNHQYQIKYKKSENSSFDSSSQFKYSFPISNINSNNIPSKNSVHLIKSDQKQKKENEENEKKLKELIERQKEKELEELKIIQNNKRKSFSNYSKNSSNIQSDKNILFRENSEFSLNNNKIKTLKDSELDQEELIINDSFDENNNINNYNNMNNNFIKGNFSEMNDYKIIYDKEITNKIKYELEQDLINKQKQNWSNSASK